MILSDITTVTHNLPETKLAHARECDRSCRRKHESVCVCNYDCLSSGLSERERESTMIASSVFLSSPVTSLCGLALAMSFINIHTVLYTHLVLHAPSRQSDLHGLTCCRFEWLYQRPLWIFCSFTQHWYINQKRQSS